MLELEKWGQGKLPLLVMLAHQIATSAEACYEACRMARTNDTRGGKVKLPSLKKWRAMYEHPEEMLATVWEKFCDSGAATENDTEMVREAAELQAFSELNKTAKSEFFKDLTWRKFHELCKEGLEAQERFYKGHLERLKAEIADKSEVGVNSKTFLSCPEVIFFLRVWFPCWIEYGKSLPDLLSEVRVGGRVEPVEKLLRLDKRVTEIANIREFWDRARQEGKAATLERLSKAMNGEPLRRFSIQKVKVVLAALVYQIFRAFDKRVKLARRNAGISNWKFLYPHFKLTTPEIRKLFDAAAKDFKHLERDTDLPRGSETFYMAVNRELPFWKELE